MYPSRSVYPENVLFDGKGRLRLGHLTTMIDLDVDPANERIDFLDYMAPEMLSLKVGPKGMSVVRVQCQGGSIFQSGGQQSTQGGPPSLCCIVG
jgi:hypothetical protein